MIGATLSHFRITAKLGEGGMGEVYRAEDTKLGRDVAIKVLPAAFLADPDRLARFEREARVLASLSHQGIAQIYEVGSEEDIHYLAMELAHGETLAERIARGSMGAAEALPIALQIAEALEAAHERGIVHRDLKPANVMVDGEGRVKVLDFGLAKALDPDPESAAAAELTHSPTMTYQSTRAGILLGTAAYMSPEQAKGKPADRRSDIWAFGLILLELLTGRRAFLEESVSETLAALLRNDPDFSALPPDVPSGIRRLIERCLRKQPRERLHDIADARIELQDAIAAGPAANAEVLPTSSPTPARGARWLPWVVAALFALLAATGWLVQQRPPRSRTDPTHLAVTLPPGLVLPEGNVAALLGISPDGGTIVFQADDGQGSRLYRRPLRDPRTIPLPGTKGAESPFFSPDGRWLGFLRGGLWKLALDGNQPMRLSEGSWGGASWGSDSTILFTPDYLAGIHRISAAGGTPESLTWPDPEQGELNHSWPDHLPGGDTAVFTNFRLPIRDSRIELLRLDDSQRRVLVEDGVFARYAASGHLLFVRGNHLMAVAFDSDNGIVLGDPAPVLEDLPLDPLQASSQVAFAANGTLAYVPGSLLEPDRPLVWLDREGREQPVLSSQGRYRGPSLSPDGRRIVLTIDGPGGPDVWICDAERGTLTRLTFSPRSELGALWHPEGNQVFFVTDRPPFDVYSVPSDGSAGTVTIQENTYDTIPQAVTRDGQWLLVQEDRQEGGYDILRLPTDGSGEAEVLRATPFHELFPTISPDGRHFAFQSNESGRSEIYVQPLDGPAGRVQVSRAGGERPLWARNGELFFLADDRLHVVEVTTTGGLRVGEPRELFPLRLSGAYHDRGYDVSADGQRLVTVPVTEESRPREIRVVLDWLQEVERRVPTGR